MSNPVSVSSEIVTEITPQVAAEAFSKMDTEAQADFFDHLAICTKSWEQLEGSSGRINRVYPYGEMQWCMLYDELKERPEAMAQYRALSVFAFNFYEPKT